MKCDFVQTWLLKCETLQSRTWPRKVGRHVKSCVSCYEFARSLKKLEKSWANQPLPAEGLMPKPAFLQKIARLEEPAPPVVSFWRRRSRMLIVAAASILIASGIIGFALINPQQSIASDVVDRLVQWDGEMSNADPEKRKKLLAEREEEFRKHIDSARLSPVERALAEKLLEIGKRLANDQEDEEDLILEVADELRTRVRYAENRGTVKEFQRCERNYSSFVEKAVNPLYSRKIVHRLIEWNTEMTNADSRKRKQLLEEHEETFKSELKAANLPNEERALAEKLLDVGRRLALNDNLVKEAELITDVADKLLVRAESAEKKGSKKESDRSAMGYSMFMEKAVNPFFFKMSMMKPVQPDPKKGGFDFSKQQKEFEKIWQKGPQFSRPDSHNRFEGMFNKKGPKGPTSPWGWGPMPGTGPGWGPPGGPKGGRK